MLILLLVLIILKNILCFILMVFKKIFGILLIFLGLTFFSFNFILISSLLTEEIKTISDICLNDLKDNYSENEGFNKCLNDGQRVNKSVQSISLILNLISFISGIFFIYKGYKFLSFRK